VKNGFIWLKKFGYILFYHNKHKKEKSNKQTKKEKKFKNKPILGLTWT